MTETENAPHAPLDPFAVDFFGGAHPPTGENEGLSETETKTGRLAAARQKSDWYKNLARITSREAEFSNLLSNLPENLAHKAAELIARVFGRYTSKENVSCSLASVTEVNLTSAIQKLSESPNVFLRIGARNQNARAIAVINADFAGLLIDSMLDGQTAGTPTGRELSPVETTIVEFLAVNILAELNDFLGENLLFLESVKSPAAGFFEPFERGAEIVLKVSAGELREFVSVYAQQRFLKSLDKSQNRIFTKKADVKKLSGLGKFVRELELRLQIGTTALEADAFLYLEPDDIVLIERPQITLENENFGGSLQIYVGSGGNFRFRGFAENAGSGGGLDFKIEDITSEETRRRFTPAKFKMDENNLAVETTSLENETPEAATGEQISPALENIQVALRVEIAGNKISLRELQSLRAGQIIALGVSPTDPVRLVTDSSDEPVATGELVEIEGQLGVRLTKIFI